MRISPIAATNTYQTKTLHSQNKKNQGLSNYTTGVDLNMLNPNYNQVNVNFKAAINNAAATLDMVKKIPLEDRLASLFKKFQLGELILVGKDLQECAKKMYKNSDLTQYAIKKSYFVADDNLNGNLAFVKNAIGDREVINLNDEELKLVSDNKTYPLKSGESFYVVKDDIISLNGSSLKIKDEPKADISKFQKVFAKSFDNQKDVKQEVDKINKKTLSKLFKTQHKGSSAITFAEVGGLKELKDALKKEIIYPIRYPQAYENIELNHGFILHGAPGTGKTHIARALANEAGANFIGLNGLELESKWAGEAEENWRNLFSQAKENQPTIIFLDEFDSVGRKREGCIDENGNKIVNQILTLMSDIDSENDDIFVIAATNNFKSLDAAITRSGRFGKHYEVIPPDFDALKEIYKINTKNKPVDENVKVDDMLKKLEKQKATGADIRQIVNDAHHNGYVRAGIFEKMDNKTFKNSDMDDFQIIQEDFDKALNDFFSDKKSMGRNPIGFAK